MRNVYEPLAEYLRRRKTNTVMLSFERIEMIIQDIGAVSENLPGAGNAEGVAKPGPAVQTGACGDRQGGIGVEQR